MDCLCFWPSRSIINNVLNVFRPKRWVLTMVADKAGLSTITENPFNVEQVNAAVHVRVVIPQRQ